MRCIFLSILLLGMHGAIAQKKTDDVIHLKNGGAIRGKILADSTLQVKIQTSDGSNWVFRKDEIDFISKEARFRTYSYKDKGFAHFTELGPLVAGKTTIDGVTTAAFTELTSLKILRQAVNMEVGLCTPEG